MTVEASPPLPRSRARIALGPSIADILLRIVVAVFGGYGLTYALTAAAAVLLVRGAGLNRVDAALISTNLALLAYPALFIFAFAARRAGVLAVAVALAATALWAVGWSWRL